MMTLHDVKRAGFLAQELEQIRSVIGHPAQWFLCNLDDAIRKEAWKAAMKSAEKTIIDRLHTFGVEP